jgi:hypothetical protein
MYLPMCIVTANLSSRMQLFLSRHSRRNIIALLASYGSPEKAAIPTRKICLPIFSLDLVCDYWRAEFEHDLVYVRPALVFLPHEGFYPYKFVLHNKHHLSGIKFAGRITRLTLRGQNKSWLQIIVKSLPPYGECVRSSRRFFCNCRYDRRFTKIEHSFRERSFSLAFCLLLFTRICLWVVSCEYLLLLQYLYSTSTCLYFQAVLLYWYW